MTTTFPELDEFLEALRGLHGAVLDLKRVQLDTNHKMNQALNDSHLKSTLTLLDQDIALRRTLELTSRS